jgi:hypothetical protein
MNPDRIFQIWRYIFPAITVLVLMLKPTSASADESGLTYGSVLKFSAGIATAALIHEGSHALVAGLTGTALTWKIGTYNQPLGFTERANSDAKGIAIYSSGLISQAIGSEVILRVDKIDKNDAYVRGMMTWNFLNPIMYTLDFWFFRVSNKSNGNGYQGDLEGIKHYSNDAMANAFALSMAAIATYQGYRFLQTQSWAPDWLRGDLDRVSLGPLPSGGLIMVYRFDF